MFRTLIRKFYAGPVYFGRRIPQGRKYQSPTLTAGLWFYAWFYRMFTMPGRILLLCTGLVALYSLMSIRMPIYNLGILMVMLFLVDFAAGFLARPRHLEIERRMPAAVRQDSPTHVIYNIKNRGKRASWSLNLDTLPMPANIKLSARHAWCDVVAPGESIQVKVELQGTKRGEYVLPALRADTSFPFHLCRWGLIHGQPQKLLVHPKFTPLREFELPVGRAHQPGGISMSSNLADSMEFYGCREYRYGDNPRHIHWRSWARTGYPVVREFRQEYFPRVALILDTYMPLPWHHIEPATRYEVFESAVSVTAAIAEYLSRQDYVVDFFAAGREVYRFQTGRSLGYLEQLLDILAGLEIHRREPFEKLRPAVTAEAGDMSGIVLILLGWNSQRRLMFEDAAARGVEIRTILINESGAPPPGFPEQGTVLTPETLPQVDRM